MKPMIHLFSHQKHELIERMFSYLFCSFCSFLLFSKFFFFFFSKEKHTWNNANWTKTMTKTYMYVYNYYYLSLSLFNEHEIMNKLVQYSSCSMFTYGHLATDIVCFLRSAQQQQWLGEVFFLLFPFEFCYVLCLRNNGSACQFSSDAKKVKQWTQWALTKQIWRRIN